MADIVEYYNKFNEDKRLLSGHGRVEFAVTMHYLSEYLGTGMKVIDIGAGTGRYSIEMAKRGMSVTAVELVKYNLGILKKHIREDLGEDADITAYQGNALKLKRCEDNSFDAALLFGPLYHLHSEEDKIKALSEAKRVVKSGGHIFVSYVMSDYALIKYGFMEHNIKKSIKEGALFDDYSIKSNPDELYDYVRLEDMDRLNSAAGLTLEKRIAQDGPSDYIRNVLNEMDEEEFDRFVDYQIKNAGRSELLGASSHVMDILVKG